MVLSMPTTVTPIRTGRSVAPAFPRACSAPAATPMFVRPEGGRLGRLTAEGLTMTNDFTETNDFTKTSDNVIATRRPMNPPNRTSG